jgi:hypothetical protein
MEWLIVLPLPRLLALLAGQSGQGEVTSVNEAEEAA